nr:PREDICTED: beta-1,3-galactosyltransferase 5 [Bemisia tabaci]XP_018902209.1 PREDICTED: beta-1,3-galactosyltransferase 5 [Bemisia tabaci]
MLEQRQKLAVIGWIVLSAVITTVGVIHVLIDPRLHYEIKETVNNYELLVAQNESSALPLDELPADEESVLLNMTDFKLIINNEVCRTATVQGSPLILAFVHSAPKNLKLRNLIRSTWGQELTTIFLLGETTPALQEAIETENSLHHDIVQGNFIDSYRNLTYKHVMGFKWASYHCPGAKYLLKTDDDVFVNVLFLRKFIESKLSPTGARKLILCDIQVTVVQRSFRSKWRVSPKEYSKNWYPQICKGWAILYSPDVSFQLYHIARKAPFFWIDDIYVSGILAPMLNVSLSSVYPFAIQRDKLSGLLSKPYIESQDDFLFGYPGDLITEMNSLWKIVKNTTRYFESSQQNETIVQ